MSTDTPPRQTSLHAGAADELAAARKRFNVAYNLATWDGDWETVAIAANAYVKTSEAHADALSAENARLTAAFLNIQEYAEARVEYYRQPQITGNRARDLIDWQHLLAIVREAANDGEGT
jgi:hypothetical protein